MRLYGWEGSVQPGRGVRLFPVSGPRYNDAVAPGSQRIVSHYITAVVEGGRLRPTVPLPPELAEGAEVRVMILPLAKPGPTAPQSREAIARIAAMPLEGDHSDRFSGRDHDQMLYSDVNGPDAATTPVPRTSWPCQAGSAKDTNHWMAPDFDAPLDDFKDYAE